MAAVKLMKRLRLVVVVVVDSHAAAAVVVAKLTVAWRRIARRWRRTQIDEDSWSRMQLFLAGGRANKLCRLSICATDIN